MMSPQVFPAGAMIYYATNGLKYFLKRLFIIFIIFIINY